MYITSGKEKITETEAKPLYTMKNKNEARVRTMRKLFFFNLINTLLIK